MVHKICDKPLRKVWEEGGLDLSITEQNKIKCPPLSYRNFDISSEYSFKIASKYPIVIVVVSLYT